MDERVSAAIVGAGPAGIAAAVYLQRYGLEPLLLEQGEPGGLLTEANLVENYPGFPDGIPGRDLASLFRRQLDRVGVRVAQERVERLSHGDGFTIDTAASTYGAAKVLIATGTVPRRADLPGAEGLEGRRLFHGLSDFPFGEGARVAVLGGGDAAFDYALNLRGRGYDVSVLSRSGPRCIPLLLERAEDRGVDVRAGVAVEGLRETDGGLAVSFAGGELEADLAVVAFGREPALGFVDEGLLRRLSGGAGTPGTDVPGLYVAGDAVRGACRQTAIAVGDGVLAAMMIQRSICDGGDGT